MNLQTANMHDAFIIFELNFIKNRKNNISQLLHASSAKSQENAENHKNREKLRKSRITLLLFLCCSVILTNNSAKLDLRRMPPSYLIFQFRNFKFFLHLWMAKYV